MDSGLLQDYPSERVDRTVWTVIAVSVSCFLSVTVTCFFCYILRVVYNSPDVDELGITLDNVERTEAHQNTRMVNSRMIND